MNIQRNPFHALVPVQPGLQEISKLRNKHATDAHFDDGWAIDCPQSGNKHHSPRTMHAGGIRDHEDEAIGHSKYATEHGKSAQDDELWGFLMKLMELFGLRSDSFKSTANKLFSQDDDSVGGIPENRAPVQHSPQVQPVPHANRNDQGISPVGNSDPSSGARNPPSSTAPVSASSPSAPASRNYANNLDEAAAKTHVKFMPVVRGDEAGENAKIHDQASFGRAVDQTALEYGLDPNQFRAQLEKESGAMRDYKSAMRLEGDLGRRSENNTSIGIGQISRKFLDGREWSDGGPNNSRVGGKTVTTEMYNSSVITQLRVAASNLAMRIQDHGNGDLKKGLNYYVSGHTESDSHNVGYINGINEIMKKKELMNIGR